jgi:hypothetical protein
VIEKTLKLFPDGACVRASSASPKALAYFGGEDDVDALEHKAVYIHEAAAIASKHEVESEFAVMLRTLISEGRLVHQTVNREGGVGPLSTKTVTKEGPIAVIFSSARDNIEPELMTRLMASDADESFAQTEAVMRAALSGGRRLVDEALLSSWRDYQLWLELDAPYGVEIPFRPAILAAYRERLKELPLRHRRDIHGFLTAIESSAILYRAQRPRDANGRIVATIDDYEYAHGAFDQGVAGLSSIAVPETLTAVVDAVAAIGAATETAGACDDGTSPSGVKVSWQALADKLGIARNTAGARLSEAVEKGLLRLITPPSGYSRTGARQYEVVKSSDELKGAADQARIKTVFPSPDEVRREIEKNW